MVARITTYAFEGIAANPVDVQVHMVGGKQPVITIVGLPDKAVAESRERVRAAFSAIGLALPPKRITVNLAPADLPKEGSHYDLPIALGVLAIMGVLAPDALDEAVERVVQAHLQAAPGAVADTKRLIAYVASHGLEDSMIYTADRLADAWETEEGIEGINSFLNKDTPSWRVS